jgi:hypothetical protein
LQCASSWLAALPSVASSASNQFGLIVAYLVPGFVALLGLIPLFPLVADWLAPIPWGEQGELGLGPPIYALLTAIAAGMVVSYVRWFFIDTMHRWSGVRSRSTSYTQLSQHLDAFHYLVEQHYRHYQFAGNMLVAISWSYTVHRIYGSLACFSISTDAAVALICLILFVGSRDNLTKFRTRVDQLVGSTAEEGGVAMTNGIDHKTQGGGEKPHEAPKGTPPDHIKPKPSASKDETKK